MKRKHGETLSRTVMRAQDLPETQAMLRNMGSLTAYGLRTGAIRVEVKDYMPKNNKLKKFR